MNCQDWGSQVLKNILKFHWIKKKVVGKSFWNQNIVFLPLKKEILWRKNVFSDISRFNWFVVGFYKRFGKFLKK